MGAVFKRKRNKKAQVTIEYFVLFMAIAVVTLLSISVLYPKIREMATRFFYEEAVPRILR